MKEISLTPTITALAKDLLGPSAKLLGTELKSYLKDTLKEFKERKREANLQRHFLAVQLTLIDGDRYEDLPKDLDAFSDWIEGAQDVGDEHPELAEMWRSLLKEIVSGKPVYNDLVKTMKNIDSSMAKLLLRFKGNEEKSTNSPNLDRINRSPALKGAKLLSQSELHAASRLEEIGLLKKDYRPILLLATGTLVVGIILWTAADYVELPLLASNLSLVVYISLGMHFVYSRFQYLKSYQATWLGRKVLRYFPADGSMSSPVQELITRKKRPRKEPIKKQL